MGTVNYKTSDYITLGIEPLSAYDLERDPGFMAEITECAEEWNMDTDEAIYCYIRDAAEEDQSNIEYELKKHNFYYYHIKIEPGYYEGFSLDIENNFPVAFNDWQEKREAQKEITEIKQFLLTCVDLGLCEVWPGWCTKYQDRTTTIKAINKAVKEMREEARQSPHGASTNDRRQSNMIHEYTAPGGSYSRLYGHMATRPHLLIAGKTGAGKSTVVNGIIHALLTATTPADTQFIMIDLKKVELSDYMYLPHTQQYADDGPQAIKALQEAIRITETRYADMKTRHLKQYDGSNLYVIIDEMADLLTAKATKAKAEEMIQRLCQIGRGARVHVIGCTQHIPTIPTAIRCNFDDRLALKTVNAQDSRNIIYQAGAERLPDPLTEHRAMGYYLTGPGPTLYDLPQVPAEEIERVITHWERQRTRAA